MEYYHEREEDNLDYDPHLHLCGSYPGGSLSYVNSVTGEFCRGPDTDDEEDFDREMSYEMYAEDCSGQQNLESEEEEVEDDSFYLNGLCMASQRNNEQPASVATKEVESDEEVVAEMDEEADEVDDKTDSGVNDKADSEMDEEADSEDDSNSVTDCVGTGSPTDPHYQAKMKRVIEDEEDDYFESHRSLDEELEEQILDFMLSGDPNLEDEDAEAGGYICHICGIKPKNMRKHYDSRHKGLCPCGFCGKVMEFCSVHEHIREFHQAETGLFVPPPKPPGAEPLEDLDLEKELDRMRGSRNWKIIKKSGYCCMYDESKHTPIAVMQRLTKASLVKKVGPKAEADTRFYAAKELKINVDHRSFKREGKVVGHLAPRADCVSSESAYKDSHSILNGTPQNPRVNGGVILVSEKLGRLFVLYWDDILIITGPIFDEDAETVTSINGVDYPIPTAFFKIFILRREGEPSRVMSFIISNKFENSNLFNRQATLQQISERTGLNLSAYQNLRYTWDLEAPMFRCPGFRCYNTFTTEAELTEHLRGHPWKCYKCCKVFPSDSEKDEHLATHRVHICQYCNAGFMAKGDVIIHERTHTGATPYVCTDPACKGISFKQKSQLNRHNKMKHSEEFPFPCEFEGCGRRFKLKQYLESHIPTHTGEKPFVCSDCGKGFPRKSSLIEHISCVHKKERPHQCEYCKKTFSKKTTLKVHIRRMHVNNPVTDSEEEHEEDPSDTGLSTLDGGLRPSDSVTSSSGNAVTGKRKNEGTSDEQPVPAKQLRLNSEGNGASISESVSSTSKLDGKAGKAGTPRASKNVILPFGCRITKCGRRFLTKEELIEHLRNFHAKSHPHICKEPGCELLAFAEKYNLVRHTNTVHNEIKDDKYKCRICGKVLSTKHNLQRHVRDTHPASDSTSDSAAPASKKPPGNAATARQKKAPVTATSTAGPSVAVSQKKVCLAPIFLKPVSAPKRNQPTTDSDPEIVTLD